MSFRVDGFPLGAEQMRESEFISKQLLLRFPRKEKKKEETTVGIGVKNAPSKHW